MDRHAVFRGPIGFTPAESKIAVGLAVVVLIASMVAVYQRLIRPAPHVAIETHFVQESGGVKAALPSSIQLPVTNQADSALSSVSRRLLDINMADYADLVRLPGIGPVLAGRIMEYRDGHGPFASIDSLINVSGIGAVKLGKIRPLICIR